MPDSKPKADEVVEDDAAVVDETTEPMEDASTEDPDADPNAQTAVPDGEAPDASTDAPADVGTPEPDAATLAADARIKKLEETIAQLQAGREPAPKTDAPAPRASHVQAFVQRAVPQIKQAFISDGATLEQQFDSIYQLTDQMLGSVLADHVEPVQDNLAARVIQLENELEIRDLRSDKTTGALFGSLESQIRAELQKTAWKDRASAGTIKKIYHRLLGERNGKPAAQPTNVKTPAAASAALRDVSAGSRVQPAKAAVGFKLTPEQEADFQAMVEDGVSITRERYHARYKARADKARAEKRPVPATLRSYR